MSIEFFKSGTSRSLTRYTTSDDQGNKRICTTDTIANYYFGAFEILEPNAMLVRNTHSNDSCDPTIKVDTSLSKATIVKLSEDRIVGVSNDLDESCMNSANTFVFEREK